MKHGISPTTDARLRRGRLMHTLFTGGTALRRLGPDNSVYYVADQRIAQRVREKQRRALARAQKAAR